MAEKAMGQKAMEKAMGHALHSFSIILGHHPTVATAKIHVGRRLLQRHDGGRGDQTGDHVVKLDSGSALVLRDKQSRSSPGAPGSTYALS